MLRRLFSLIPVLFTFTLGACDAVEALGPALDEALTPPPPPVVHQLILENRSTWTVNEVRFSPCTDSNYGPNRLAGFLSPGYQVSFNVGASGCYDVYAKSTNGRYWEFKAQVSGVTRWNLN
jgi:hypothetical protein